MPIVRHQFDQLEVLVYADRVTMGKAAAEKAALLILKCLEEKGEANVAFAAAPSQDEFLKELIQIASIPWHRVRAFHLDEYLGLSADAPQRFSRYLQEHIFRRVSFREVHYIDLEGKDPPEVICARYRYLLDQHPLDIAFIGIGENGHIAFNDPPVADFEDPCKVKVVRLDAVCRRQQVYDGCFHSLDEVPTHAVTLTIPAIMEAKAIVCVVPGARKREIIKRVLEGPITTDCPASILRKHPRATLFLDKESAALILSKGG